MAFNRWETRLNSLSISYRKKQTNLLRCEHDIRATVIEESGAKNTIQRSIV